MAVSITKNSPKGAISNHVPMLGVLATPPSGDSSEYRFLYFYCIMKSYPVSILVRKYMWIKRGSFLVFSLA